MYYIYLSSVVKFFTLKIKIPFGILDKLEYNNHNNGDEHISALTDEDHELNCPICEFLATRQLYDSGMEPFITEIQPIGNIISIKNVFLAKTGLSLTEPRAPPVFTSL
jgi:hypothetical protein